VQGVFCGTPAAKSSAYAAARSGRLALKALLAHSEHGPTPRQPLEKETAMASEPIDGIALNFQHAKA
jgi:hypothetical protein